MSYGPLCKGNCQVCNYPARHPLRFKPNDRFRINTPGICRHGKTGTIERVYWRPCRGNWYLGKTDDNIEYSTNDKNFRVSNKHIEKIGKQKTLSQY